jgi:hypothetical protein
MNGACSKRKMDSVPTAPVTPLPVDVVIMAVAVTGVYWWRLGYRNSYRHAEEIVRISETRRALVCCRSLCGERGNTRGLAEKIAAVESIISTVIINKFL